MNLAAASFQPTSSNKKFSRIEKVPYPSSRFRFRPTPRGPFVSSTYVSIAATCSDACPFKRGPDGAPGGCFIDAEHFTRKATAALDEKARGKFGFEVIQQEVAVLDRAWPRGIPQDGARGGRDLRIHVGGDTPDERSARMLAGAAARWLGRGGGSVWTYSHTWRSIAAGSFWPISVLASVETPAQVLEARASGYAPALVVDRFPNGKRTFVVASTTFIPCPAETIGKTCAECRLCLDVDLAAKGQGIAFALHGDDAMVAQRKLTQLATRRAA